ncbi:MAG: hypothetical protein AB2598_20850 [Candidatus Thiodiazotropha sp.]
MIQFLKKLLKGLGKSDPDPEPTPDILENETISRFLTSSGHLAKSKRIVKYGAFLPNGNGETSVYRITGATNPDIWDIGENYVRAPIAKKRGSCNLHGRGDIEAKEILDTKLTIEPKPRPHPRHADIMSWPESKEEKQMLATELANKSVLHLPSD